MERGTEGGGARQAGLGRLEAQNQGILTGRALPVGVRLHPADNFSCPLWTWVGGGGCVLLEGLKPRGVETAGCTAVASTRHPAQPGQPRMGGELGAAGGTARCGLCWASGPVPPGPTAPRGPVEGKPQCPGSLSASPLPHRPPWGWALPCFLRCPEPGVTGAHKQHEISSWVHRAGVSG